MNSNGSNQTMNSTLILVLYFYIWPTICHLICFYFYFPREVPEEHPRQNRNKIQLKGATRDSSLAVKSPIGSHVRYVAAGHHPSGVMSCHPSLVHAGLLGVIQISHSATSWKYLCDTEDTLRPPRMQMHIPLQSFLSLLPMPYAKQTSSCWCRTFSGCDKHKHAQH